VAAPPKATIYVSGRLEALQFGSVGSSDSLILKDGWPAEHDSEQAWYRVSCICAWKERLVSTAISEHIDLRGSLKTASLVNVSRFVLFLELSFFFFTITA